MTNSSSASFIIYFDYCHDWTFEELKEEFLEDLQKGYISEYGYGRQVKNLDIIELLPDGRVRMEYWIAMYNGYEDVPAYMIDLVMRSHQTKESDDDLPPYGIKNVEFEVRRD